jgi:hypothetical protein
MTAPPEPTPPADKTFTQADIDAATARARSDGQRQGKAGQADAIKEALGCTLDEAKAMLEKAKADDDAKLSEVQKREKAADDREAAATAREAAASARIRDALIRAELVAAGAGSAITDDTERRDIIADAAKLVTVADDADEAAIREAVGKVKARHAGMFGTPGAPSLPHNPPAGGAPAPVNAPKSLDEIAKQNFPHLVAS